MAQFGGLDLHSMSPEIPEIQETMIAVATGQAQINEKNESYRALYLTVSTIYENAGMDHPNPHPDLWHFYHYWKENLPSYSARRAYVAETYRRPPNGAPDSLLSLIHPSIMEVSLPRFRSGQYADAVEAALKQVNTRVKDIVRAHNQADLDGARLMKHAFGIQNPIIILDELATESGRSTQLGYMELFSGAMTGIRNPKAHANLSISKERCIHFLFLASLLMFKIDEKL